MEIQCKTRDSSTYDVFDIYPNRLETATMESVSTPGYTFWSEWDSCTVECGSGTKKRSRDHSDGTEEIEEIACNTAPCGKISGGEEYF